MGHNRKIKSTSTIVNEKLKPATAVKKKRKRRNPDNAPYNPKKANRKKANKLTMHPAKMGFDHRKTYIDDQGNEKPIITSFIIVESKPFYQNAFKDPEVRKAAQNDQHVIANRLIKKIQSEPTFAPIKNAEKISRKGSPIEVTTVNGDKLTRVAKIKIGSGNSIAFYSNDPHHKPYSKKERKKEIDKNSDFFESEHHKSLKKPSEKTGRVHVTKELVLKTKKDPNKRGAGQQKAMVAEGVSIKDGIGSATEYVKAAGITNQPYVWSHLIPNKITGKASQVEKNLVAASEKSNVEQLIWENLSDYLLLCFKAGYWLTPKSDTIEKTHIGKNIHQIIETLTFDFEIGFDTQIENLPHVAFHNYTKSIVELLVEYPNLIGQANAKASPSHSDVTVNKPHTVFFEKKQPAANPVLDTKTPINTTKQKENASAAKKSNPKDASRENKENIAPNSNIPTIVSKPPISARRLKR